jgi:hypothetical protein
MTAANDAAAAVDAPSPVRPFATEVRIGDKLALLEFLLLRRKLAQRIGRVGLAGSFLAASIGATILGCLAGLGSKWALAAVWPNAPAYIVAIPVCGVFGMVYFVVAALFGVAQAQRILRRVVKVITRRR